MTDPQPHMSEEGYFSDEAATFGDRLAAAREAAGFNHRMLAMRLGVKTQTVRNWEEDRSEPRANMLNMTAGLLNVPIAWLISGEGDGPADLHGQDADTLREVRTLRVEAMRLAERLARLEKQLRIAADAG